MSSATIEKFLPRSSVATGVLLLTEALSWTQLHGNLFQIILFHEQLLSTSDRMWKNYTSAHNKLPIFNNFDPCASHVLAFMPAPLAIKSI